MMKTRKTYILGGATRLATRRDRGAVGGVGSLETAEARAEGRLDLLIQNLEASMLQSVPRQDQRLLVDLRVNGVIHMGVTSLHHRAVVPQVVLGSAEVHGQRGLRLRVIGLLSPHHLIDGDVMNHLPGLCLGHLYREKKILCI